MKWPRERGSGCAFCAPRGVGTPGFALTAMTTLALGVGASTAVFIVISGVLLRPRPYAEPKSAGAGERDPGTERLRIETNGRVWLCRATPDEFRLGIHSALGKRAISRRACALLYGKAPHLARLEPCRKARVTRGFSHCWSVVRHAPGAKARCSEHVRHGSSSALIQTAVAGKACVSVPSVSRELPRDRTTRHFCVALDPRGCPLSYKIPEQLP